MFSRVTSSSLLLLAALLCAGCGDDTISYRLNFEGKDRAAVESDGAPEYPDERLEKIQTAMTAVFGTPDRPFAWPEMNLDQRLLNLSAGPTGSSGIHRGLYREHCAHCHGISGDGLGPTARFLNPYPRDYRPGIFKFTSTKTGDGTKPVMEDLHRTLIEGVNGTAMPSFKVALTPREVDSLAEYVKYLAIRGESERFFFDAITAETEVTPALLTEIVGSIKDEVVSSWDAAEEQVVTPGPRGPRDTREQVAESIEKGRKLFQSEKAACYTCHGPTGMGDGPQVIVDVWNKGKEEHPDWFSLPFQQIKPRNLRVGIFRGGRRNVDLYRRISEGIKGSGMPGKGKLKSDDEVRAQLEAANPGVEVTPEMLEKANPGLTSEEIWNLVDYVRSLPFQPVNQRPDQPLIDFSEGGL